MGSELDGVHRDFRRIWPGNVVRHLREGVFHGRNRAEIFHDGIEFGGAEEVEVVIRHFGMKLAAVGADATDDGAFDFFVSPGADASFVVRGDVGSDDDVGSASAEEDAPTSLSSRWDGPTGFGEIAFGVAFETDGDGFDQVFAGGFWFRSAGKERKKEDGEEKCESSEDGEGLVPGMFHSEDRWVRDIFFLPDEFVMELPILTRGQVMAKKSLASLKSLYR